MLIATKRFAGNFAWAILLTMTFMFTPMSIQADDNLAFMDRWDYDDPAATREEFRTLLRGVDETDDEDYVVALLTQIARTFSIQGEFDTAHAELDGLKPHIRHEQSSGYVLYLLERGRTWNSASEKDKAIPLFRQAFDIARQIDHDYLAVDAAHMLGIALPVDEQHEWNMKALEIAEASDSQRAKNWLGSLYNNIGWTWFDQSEYDKALDHFEKAVEFRREQDQPRRLHIAKWAVGRTLRAMGKNEQALDIQLSLAADNKKSGQQPDGFVMQELGELFLGEDDERARSYFIEAWKQLSQNPWLKEHEPDRLERLRKLSGVPKSEAVQ